MLFTEAYLLLPHPIINFLLKSRRTKFTVILSGDSYRKATTKKTFIEYKVKVIQNRNNIQNIHANYRNTTRNNVSYGGLAKN